MAEKARLLKVKAHLKKRQPIFLRQGAHKHKRVKKAWRSPKGLHSKMRDSRRGYKVKLQQGYHTPKDVRGMDKHGLYPTIVASLTTLATLDPAKHSVILSGTLGARKRIIIIEAANAKKFTLYNAKADTATVLKTEFEKRAKDKKVREADKSAKKKTLEEKANSTAKEAKDADKSEPAHKHDHKHADGAEHKHAPKKDEN